MKQSALKRGRVQQKARTRTKILDAAKMIMNKKQMITLEDVAKKAKISRATIYRYFDHIDLLITEVSLDIHHKSPEQLFEEAKDMSLEDRVFYIQGHYNQQALENEIVFRRYMSSVLSKSISSKKQLRGARRVKSLNKILEEHTGEIDSDTRAKLISAASVLMGIDSVIVCKDVCGLSNEETNVTLRWALEMILKGIQSESSNQIP